MGAVGAAWVLTFVVIGGDVLPALSSNPTDPVTTAATPGTSAYAQPTPIGPATSTPTPTAGSTAKPGKGSTKAPGKLALSAEALATLSPVGGSTLTARPPARRAAPPVIEFRMSSFNVLGSSHTRGPSKRPQKESGSTRMGRATDYVISHDISLVGFQELQPDQRRVFLNRSGGRYGLYPGGSSLDGDNSIAWRLDTWELVKPGSASIPYFGGRPRNMPVLLLRHKATGITLYMANFHNPADTRQYGKQGKWRAAAKAREVTLFSNLKNEGYPVFVTGDMNEKQSWFCSVAGPGDLKAAAGGEGGRNGCSVAGGYRIDWLVGSHDVEFSGYTEDKSAYVKRMTDHPIVYSDVRIDSRDFPKSVQ